MSQNLKKNIFHAVLLISLTAFAIWFALKDDYQQVVENLRNIQMRWVFIIIGLGILYYVIQGYILKIIASKYNCNIRIRDGIDNAYIAAFFNGVTPLGGGQVAQSYAFRKLAFSYQNIASILWTDFFIYQMVVVVYAGVLILIKFTYALSIFHGYFLLVILGFLINSFVIITLWTMSKFPKLYVKISQIAVKLLYKIHVVKDRDKTLIAWEKQVVYFTSEISKLKDSKRLVIKAVILNFIRMSIYYMIPFVVAIALGMNIHFHDLLNVMVLSSFIHMLNALTPLPGDTGWTESAFIIIFGSMFTRSGASSVMILWRVATYHVNVLLGALVFMKVNSSDPLKRKQHKIIQKDN